MILKQECIPVGCVPPTLYRKGGSVSGGSLSMETYRGGSLSDRQTSFAGGNNFVVVEHC